ncbi:hypothetical protein OPV22_010755 [Ensete ventricosum]|uniref:Uncharacterized protein n=1 Tax=Ensete ventricosum TaxID=4639 RepID=A0AAV8RLW0_ENSVE|nr:hypothetical protein OPV22_010755 [Ensete ventricosum]
MLTKQASQKASCLCSPTTHAGSFRCRLHRNSLHHSSASVGSGLSELAEKMKFRVAAKNLAIRLPRLDGWKESIGVVTKGFFATANVLERIYMQVVV